MPVRTIPGTDVQYHLICFNADGVEVADSDGAMLSETVQRRLADRVDPITDVFFASHGWKGDVPAAIDQYDRWVGAMASSPDHAAATVHRPGFRSLVIGVHWPSLPFGDETIPGEGGVLGADDGTDIEAAIDQFAASIADTRTARAAIRVILEAAQRDDGERETLPEPVRRAYEQLAMEASITDGDDNPGGAPGQEQGAWDADAIYHDARTSGVPDDGASGPDAVTPGLLSWGVLRRLKGLIVAPLQQMSFWKMKDRARRIGEGGAHDLLVRLQKAAPASTHFHLMGHSFGCIVMSATVAGTATSEPLARPVDTLFLVQGALSLWSYSPDIPLAPGQPGYFNRILKGGLVRGPIITTQSRFDTAVGRLYPAAARLKSQLVLGDELPRYGGVGTFGIHGIGTVQEDRPMESATFDYGFTPGRVYNLESSGVIKTGGGFSGSHSDIAHPEVAHVLWQAVFAAPQ